MEADLSLPSAPDCIEGVPKASPDGTRVLLFRACAGEAHSGVTLTDTAGSYRAWITDGFGADWNPVANGGTNPCHAGPTALCLNNGRFEVSARFDAGGGNSGTAKVVPLTSDTGYLWFFAASNVEAVVKVLTAADWTAIMGLRRWSDECQCRDDRDRHQHGDHEDLSESV